MLGTGLAGNIAQRIRVFGILRPHSSAKANDRRCQ